MVVVVFVVILVVGQAWAGRIPFQEVNPRYRGDSSAVNFGAYEASAVEAVVVEAFANNRQPRQFGVNFVSSSPGYGDSNMDCRGYSMLGCV